MAAPAIRIVAWHSTAIMGISILLQTPRHKNHKHRRPGINTPAPIGSSEGIESLDVIRGIALLGIFIMNTPYFGASMFAGANGSHLFNAPYDRIAADARDLLFSGKFNSMFSALFAIGFTIQYARLQAADPSRATAIYVRRLLVLLGIGIIHGYFIGMGDILHTFALLGLLAGRHRWIQRAAEFRPLKIQWTDFVGGFSCRLCRMVLTFFYVCGILLQTAVGLTVFYGWSFGLWNQVGPLLTMVCVIAFYFIVQVPLSRWWLASHRFGPMEWLWRALTYGRLPHGEPQPVR
jgi:uncharacterized membrane protein YeiB